MSLRSLAPRQRRHPEVRLTLIVLALALTLAPALDRMAEAGALNGHSQPAKTLDLCAVPGLILTPVAPRPVEPVTLLTAILILHFPSPAPRLTDHPPRPA